MEGSTKLTKELMEQYGWQKMIADCEKKERFQYCSLFCAKAAAAREAGDQTALEVFWLLGRATSVAVRSDSKSEPFPEDWLLEFTDEQISLFRELALGVEDAELRARFADLVWERRRDPEMGRLAVEAYLESAHVLEDPRNWTACAKRIERATNIARLLGPKSEHFRRAVEHTEAVLDRYDGEDPLFLSAVLMELLLEHRQGDGSKYAALAGRAAARAVAEKEWERARRYLHIKCEWHFLAKQPDEERAAREEWIETFVQEAEEIVNTPGRAAPYNHASFKLEQAYKAYQELGGPGAKERRAEIYRLLVEYQGRINEEFITIAAPMGAEREAGDKYFAEYAVNQVKGRGVVEAIAALAFLPALGSVSQLHDQVRQRVSTSPTFLLFPTVMYTADGRVAARPSRATTREEQIADEVRAQMFVRSNDLRTWGAQTLLLPAIDQINSEHHVRMRDLLPIVLSSPFVPAGREVLFAKGLHAGLTGDYIVAAHLLIPQIENSLRHILTQSGEVTSGMSRQDVQNLFDLNRMLTADALETKLTEILGADLVFQLKGLLVQHYGANLRNEIAHGTLGVNELSSGFYGLQAIYAWWLALRLCLTCILSADEPAQQEAVSA